MVGVLVGGLISALIRSLHFIYIVNKTVMKQSFVKELVMLFLNFVIGVGLYIVFRGRMTENFVEWIVLAFVVASVNGMVLLMLNVMIDRVGFLEVFKRIKKVVKN